MKTLILTLAVFVLLVGLVLAPRMIKDIGKKVRMPNTYAIVNVGTGKAIRVRDAGPADGVEIIQYTHHNWECMTWQFVRLKDGAYLLNNLYTLKSFQPNGVPQDGMGLWQQPIGGSQYQNWEFIEQPDGTCLIRLQGTDLYATAVTSEENAPVLLKARQGGEMQRWKRIRQSPWI